MPIKVAVVSQKGGVGKSSIARLIAREFADNGWCVTIADMDVQQATSYHWSQRRAASQTRPEIHTDTFTSLSTALTATEKFDMVVFDGAPHASRATREMARTSDFVILPTGLAVDDLHPQVGLAHELTHQHGVDPERLAFVLWRVGDSKIEIQHARAYIKAAGYRTVAGAVPERIAYRRASDAGLTVTETIYQTLNQRADTAAQNIIDAITKIANSKVA